ncbi:MAG: hypothetical protein Fur006_31250 [Coleofasciculaceae cyanobacterium]
MSFIDRATSRLKQGFNSSIKPISEEKTNAVFSQEFQGAANFLISKLQTNEIKNFLLNKFGLDSENAVSFNIDYLADFEKSRKVRLGAFYTPESCVRNIISKIEIREDQKYLDPGVGTGNFILPLINKLITNFPSISLDEVLDCVYGFDIDAEALELCKIRVVLELEKKFNIDYCTYKKINLYVTDFTVKAPDGMNLLKDFNVIYRDLDDVITLKSNPSFDYVFGNPPFVTFYGRRSKKLPESHREYYLRNYNFVPGSVKNGKLNLYMFFIEHGLNLLKAGGNLIYLLDNSIYENSAYYLRKWVLENFQLISITMGLDDFDNVTSGQTVWHIKKATPQNFVLIQNHSQNNTHRFDQKIWLKNHECRIEFSSENSIVKKLSKYGTLINYFPKKSIRTCCMLLDLTENFLVNKEEYEKDESGLIMPYLEGGKSLSDPDKPFKFSKYIKYDYQLQLSLSDAIRIQLQKEGIKNKKRIGLGSLEVYQAPKIFIRQSCNRLIAKFTNENFMANNSLYVITPIYSSFKKEDWQNVLIYTERLLCSKLYLYLAYQMKVIRKNIKQQPQIKISDLKRLPFLIDINSEFFFEIVNLFDGNRNEIDRLIYDKFYLSSHEIHEIETFSQSV